MLIPNLQYLFRRDLEKLKVEILSYKNEENIWRTDHQIANSAGNLCLHLIGNLNAYIGAEFGKTGYIRNRDLEFSEKNVPTKELVQRIEETIHVVEQGLGRISLEDLEKTFPIEIGNQKMGNELLLIHLVTHLNYHLGQINYHRRLLD